MLKSQGRLGWLRSNPYFDAVARRDHLEHERRDHVSSWKSIAPKMTPWKK